MTIAKKVLAQLLLLLFIAPGLHADDNVDGLSKLIKVYEQDRYPWGLKVRPAVKVLRNRLADGDTQLLEAMLSLYERSLRYAIREGQRKDLFMLSQALPKAFKVGDQWIASHLLLVKLEELLVEHDPKQVLDVLHEIRKWGIESYPEYRKICVTERLWNSPWKEAPARPQAVFLAEALSQESIQARTEGEAHAAAVAVVFGGYERVWKTETGRSSKTIGANVWPHLSEKQRQAVVEIAFHDDQAYAIQHWDNTKLGGQALPCVMYERDFVSRKYYAKWLVQQLRVNRQLHPATRLSIWRRLAKLDAVPDEQLQELKGEVLADCHKYAATAIRIIRDPDANPRVRIGFFERLTLMQDLVPDDTFKDLQAIAVSLRNRPTAAKKRTEKLLNEIQNSDLEPLEVPLPDIEAE